MKKILFVAFAATLLAASCQKTEIINPVSPNGEPAMSFPVTCNTAALRQNSGTVQNCPAAPYYRWEDFRDFYSEIATNK